MHALSSSLWRFKRVTTCLGACALAGFVACGSSEGEGPGGGGAAPDASPAGSSSGFVGGETADGGGSGTVACSGDLTHIVDGRTGAVLATCPPEQGCAAGVCVPACQAAAASHGSVGCDYVVPTPVFNGLSGTPCFAIFVANNWSKPAKVQVTRDGEAYDVSKFGRIAAAGQAESAWLPVPSDGIPVGQVAVLFMSSKTGSTSPIQVDCPVAPALVGDPAIRRSGRGPAWHLTTDAPVTTYDILPYGGAKSVLPSAELVLPTSAWGTNYYGVVPSTGTNPGQQWGQIVAATDGTTVQVLPSVTLPGGPAGSNVDAAPVGVTTTYTLNAGEVLQWLDTKEMSGTVLAADKPIAFVGGNGYACYKSATSQGGGCDAAHQQIPPVSAFGSTYVGAAYATRRPDGQPESIMYRLLAAADDTQLTYDPPVPGAPAVAMAGTTVEIETTSSFVVKSQDDQHPFYVAQLMAGCRVPGNTGDMCPGDEEFVNLVPPAQFLSRYVFFTDPTYPTTTLVITRSRGQGTFHDVSVDCVGPVSGWQPVDAAGSFERATVDLVREGVAAGACSNGPHAASSDGPFGIMVWGTGNAASYAYPAGGNVAPINTVVVPTAPN